MLPHVLTDLLKWSSSSQLCLPRLPPQSHTSPPFSLIVAFLPPRQRPYLSPRLTLLSLFFPLSFSSSSISSLSLTISTSTSLAFYWTYTPFYWTYIAFYSLPALISQLPWHISLRAFFSTLQLTLTIAFQRTYTKAHMQSANPDLFEIRVYGLNVSSGFRGGWIVH
jgi:hypothetical protein